VKRASNTSLNHVLERHAKKRTNLTVKKLDRGTVLLEGDSEALRFLAELLLAHIEERDDGFQIGPLGPGSVFFTPESTLGIYVHRLPCTKGRPNSR
jgi:hypothetical protein